MYDLKLVTPIAKLIFKLKERKNVPWQCYWNVIGCCQGIISNRHDPVKEFKNLKANFVYYELLKNDNINLEELSKFCNNWLCKILKIEWFEKNVKYTIKKRLKLVIKKQMKYRVKK